MLVVALGSLVIYGNTAFGHTSVKVCLVFLMVPLASWQLAAIVVPNRGVHFWQAVTSR
jgi:hypothetical protein